MSEIRSNTPQPVTGQTPTPRAVPTRPVAEGPVTVGRALQVAPTGLPSDPHRSAPITRLQSDIAQATLGEGGAAGAFRGGAEFCLDPREQGTATPQSRMRFEDLVPGTNLGEVTGTGRFLDQRPPAETDTPPAVGMDLGDVTGTGRFLDRTPPAATDAPAAEPGPTRPTETADTPPAAGLDLGDVAGTGRFLDQRPAAEPAPAPVANPAPGRGADEVARSAGQGIRAVGETGRALDELGRAGGRSLQVPGRALGLAGDVMSLPANVDQARRSIAQARATGSQEDIERAAGDTAAAGSNVLSAGVNATELTRHVATNRATRDAARALQQATPNVPAEVRNAAARTAAGEVVMERATTEVAERAAMRSGGEAARAGGQTLAAGVGAPNRAAARALLQEGGEAAARAATGSVARSAVATGARAAGRFVPGVNVAIAALDTASAAAALRDPNASTGRRITSVVTAAGSVAAATNIFGVSQVGAAVSGVSSFFGSFF